MSENPKKEVEPLLVVESRVRLVMEKHGEYKMTGEFMPALSKKVEQLVHEAVSRAKENGRKTLKDCDV